MSNADILDGPTYPANAGPEILSAFFVVFLFGVVAACTLYYFNTYRRDRLPIRVIVGVSVAALCLQSGGIIAAAWEVFVARQAQFESIEGRLVTGLKIAVCVVPIPVVLAQTLFAERCYW